MTERQLEHVWKGQPTSDGAGVRLTRVLSPEQGLDPFLLFDEFDSAKADEYIGGFPPHPHRGFETVTYMLDGHMLHEDHLGNRGDLKAGGVQWMTAGRGIIHSEMPQQAAGRMRGFQLWVNLPAAEKMKPASYRDIAPQDIPEVSAGEARVRVIAGRFQAPGAKPVAGPVAGGATDPLYFDVTLPAGASLEVPVPEGHRVLAYAIDGSPEVAGQTIPRGMLAVLSDGAAVALAAKSEARVLLLGGRPLHEPVVHYGPFVMNSREEIEQALRDYRDGTLATVARAQ